MRKIIKIGGREFKSKKDAILHYRRILNSYKFGEELNDVDFKDVIELLKNSGNFEHNKGVGIKAIKVTEIRYRTRVFEIIRKDNSTKIFSYIQKISSPPSNFTRFCSACRNIVEKDLRKVKLLYFEKNSKQNKVKCQESGEKCSWTELVVDHRQPNTFSVIVDRFIELHKIELKNIKYIQLEKGGYILEDENLVSKFRLYHNEKANLRIVKKELNSSRAFQGRIKRQNKDLKVKSKN